MSQGAKSFGQVVIISSNNCIFQTIFLLFLIKFVDKQDFTILSILEKISYDAYCGMMDYIQASDLWNPYEHGKELVKWIATYYSFHKQKGKKRKDCQSNLPQKRTLSKKGTRAFNFAKISEDQYDNDAPVWDISLEELSDAYKTTAMKRHLKWDTDKNQEGKSCLPFWKIFNKRGNFPRRITWLYVEDGNILCLLLLFKFSLIY